MKPSVLASLVPSWQIHLRAERKTEGTIKTYLDGVRPYLAWCDAGGHDPLDRLTSRHGPASSSTPADHRPPPRPA